MFSWLLHSLIKSLTMIYLHLLDIQIVLNICYDNYVIHPSLFIIIYMYLDNSLKINSQEFNQHKDYFLSLWYILTKLPSKKIIPTYSHTSK